MNTGQINVAYATLICPEVFEGVFPVSTLIQSQPLAPLKRALLTSIILQVSHSNTIENIGELCGFQNPQSAEISVRFFLFKLFVAALSGYLKIP